MLLDAPTFDDGRGRYPDKITVAVPRGFRQAVSRVAEADRKTAAELIREAIERHVDEIEQGGRARG